MSSACCINQAYAVRYSRWKQGWGTELLRQILSKVQEFNIIDVYIVCRENNIGSIKVIEKNGGRFTNTVVDEEGNLNNVYHIVIK
ncbi:MAG: GNAT family N-acetyltransferase [Herbinix sp.]|nr:GNAT family N-acetyltransferase [Herbinix sp.]